MDEVTREQIKKIYVRLAMKTGTSMDFFASLSIANLLEYMEIIEKEV